VFFVTGKEFLRRLKAEGWKLDRVHGSHHIMVKGERTLSVPVHGSKDLPKGLLRRLMKEAGLT
jgi:predicted RNA binding protein YcfA (HicA-like mRNA interferase family)